MCRCTLFQPFMKGEREIKPFHAGTKIHFAFIKYLVLNTVNMLHNLEG